MPIQVKNNEVVLMGTQENFPWKTIDPSIADLFITISASANYIPTSIGPILSVPRESTNHLNENENENDNKGIDLLIINDSLWFSFFGRDVFVCSFHRDRPPFPIGAITFHAHIQMEGDVLTIKSKGMVGDLRTEGSEKINRFMTRSGGSDIRNGFKDLSEIAFQDPNINTLQTKLKWSTRPSHGPKV